MKNKEYIGFVYMWQNVFNNKKYIGLHVGKDNDSYIGSGVAFKRAVRAHGIDSFKRNILYYEYTSIENLYQKEFDIINKHNAVKDRLYYNLTNHDPKCSVNGVKHRAPMSKETRNKIRKAKLGSKASHEARLKMSESRKGKPSPTKGMKDLTCGEVNGMYGKKWFNKGVDCKPFLPNECPNGWVLGKLHNMGGENNPFYGKSHTEETKQKISANRKGKCGGGDNPFYGKKHTEATKLKMRGPRKSLQKVVK